MIRAGKIFHIITVSATGGGILACAVLLGAGVGVGPETAAGLNRALYIVFTWTVKYPFLVLLAGATFLSACTPWGFYRHRWVALKWFASAFLVAATVLWGAPAIEGLAALSDSFKAGTPEYIRSAGQAGAYLGLMGAAYIALIALSVCKPFGAVGRNAPKRRPLVSAILVLASLAPSLFIAANELALEPIRRMPITGIDMAAVEDGLHRGRAKVGSFEYEVEAFVLNGRLESARAVKNRNSPYALRAEGVLEKAVRYGRNDVDAVTAATTTSKALLKALEAALSAPAMTP